MKSAIAAVGFLMFVLSCTPLAALAQAWPTKPIRVVLPFPPGGGADLVMRAMAPRLTDRLGQSVVVENRPGASGNIGMDIVAKASPDGHTVGVASTAIFSINPFVGARTPFDPLKDLAPITMLASIPFILVTSPSFPANSAGEIIALARKQPEGMSYGHAGNGTLLHLSVELLKLVAGFDMLAVPYKGSPAAVADLMGGRLTLAIGELPAVQSQIRAGKLKALGVTTARRIAAAPEIPTIAESGVPGFDTMGWLGLVAPSDTSIPIVNRWNAEVVALLGNTEIRERLSAAGAEPAPTTPQEFSAIIRAEMPKWAKVVKALGKALD